MKRLLKQTLRRFGFDFVRYTPPEILELASVRDLSDEQKKILSTVRPFTMTSVERIAALINAVTFVTQNEIPGDIAECGVWRGGSMMTIALTLLAHGDTSRSLYLFDTFEGMSPPTEKDKNLDGISAHEQLQRDPQGTGTWCHASIEDARKNILSTGYPEEKVHLIKGKVEDTIPLNNQPNLSLLRLDTDWYESTKHELKFLFPKLYKSGILIIDDYGHWQGAKNAVDEYFSESTENVYLHRIDYTGRMVVRSGL